MGFYNKINAAELENDMSNDYYNVCRFSDNAKLIIIISMKLF